MTSKNMKCPNDQAGMEKGYFFRAHWVKGDKPALSGLMVVGGESKFATAWRCPKCGKIELYTEMETK